LDDKRIIYGKIYILAPMKRSQTTFWHSRLLMLVVFFLLISCGKDKGLDNGPDNQPDTSIPPAPLKISKIDIIPGRAYIGLRILLRAQLADSSGSIDYHWRIYLGGKELSQKYDGKGLSTIACSLSEF
jgi:hypothetical protein